MFSSTYSLASALNKSAENHRVVSNNLAHLNVAGYRREISVFESVFDDEKRTPQDVRFNGIQNGKPATDFSVGSIKRTNRPLDMAINGDAFFEVQGPNGPLYTRSGSFKVNFDGTLVSPIGMPVVGEGGPITIPPEASQQELTISPTGQISSGPLQLGKIKLVAFNDNAKLERAGTTLFRAGEAGPKEPEADVRIQNNSLEMTNVSATVEMVSMVVGLRHYEAVQNALNSISQAIEKSSNPNN